MMKKTVLPLLLLLLLVVTFAHYKSQPSLPAEKESALERVTRTGVLRCGYGLWAPGLIKDPRTGKLSGIFYDFLEAIGQHAGLKIEWTGEIGWGDFPTALNDGRIDAMCFGAWPIALVAREVIFTNPTYYLPFRAYVREGDTRFDNQLDKINDPHIVIATMDSELSSQLATNRFPKAKTFSVPQLLDSNTLMLNVAANKADVTFTDAWTAAAFMEKNPGKMRAVESAPLRLYGHTIPVGKKEQGLANLLNVATEEILTSGEFDIILKKYATIPGVLLMQKRAYE